MSYIRVVTKTGDKHVLADLCVMRGHHVSADDWVRTGASVYTRKYVGSAWARNVYMTRSRVRAHFAHGYA